MAAAIATAKKLGLKPKAVIPVDLFGLPADHAAVAAVAQGANLFILDDAAQAFGATYQGRPLGSFGHATATSFFPAKPLGCYGDGGAVFTDDDQLAETLLSLRVHGHGSDKYDNIRIGLTSRLDTIQAAILSEKLKIFPDEIAARERAAPLLRGKACRCRHRADGAGRLDVGVGAIHHSHCRRPTRQGRRPPQGRGRSDRDLLSDPAASPAGLQALPGGRGRHGGERRLSPPRCSACRCMPISTPPTQDRIIGAVRRALAR